MLPDAALYEEKARDANRKSYSKHAPAFPLEPHRLAYTVRERLKRTRSLPISAERDARVSRKRTTAGLPVSTSAQLLQKVDGKCQPVKWHEIGDFFSWVALNSPEGRRLRQFQIFWCCKCGYGCAGKHLNL